jgi:hypothetical protein
VSDHLEIRLDAETNAQVRPGEPGRDLERPLGRLEAR